MTTIMQSLRLEHANIARLLEVLEGEVDNGDEADFDLVKSIADYFLTYPDQYHHPKEDLVYRALLAAEPEVGAALDDLEAEHVELAERTKEFAFAVDRILSGSEAPGDWFDALARSFIRYYRQHMAKEDTGFFVEAERLLGPETFSELEAQVTDPADPLFDLRAADRLERLRSSVAAVS